MTVHNGGSESRSLRKRRMLLPGAVSSVALGLGEGCVRREVKGTSQFGGRNQSLAEDGQRMVQARPLGDSEHTTSPPFTGRPYPTLRGVGDSPATHIYG